MKHVIFYMFIGMLAACSKSNPGSTNSGGGNTGGGGNGNNPPPSLSVNITNIEFPDKDSSTSITITGNIAWTVSDDQSWITPSVSSGNHNGSFSIAVTRNTALAERSGTVTIQGGGLTRTIAIKQKGYPNNDGVTLMRATGGVALYHENDNNGRMDMFASEDGFSTAVRLLVDTSGFIRIRLVNAQLGIVSVKTRVTTFNYTHVEVDFSNINQYTSSSQAGNPDTSGKLQIWIDRADGQNIMAASGTRAVIKRIIQVPGLFPADPKGYGIIRLLEYDHPKYSVRPPAITLKSLLEIFEKARWKTYQFTWPL
jgi:hypothetical protein